MRADTWEGCTPDGKPPVVGQEYEITHTRKGTFRGRVKSADDSTWATVEITNGEAGAILRRNARFEGDEVTVRSSLCVMTPVEVTP